MNQVGLSTVVRERGSIAKEAMHACYHFSFIVGRFRNRLMTQSRECISNNLIRFLHEVIVQNISDHEIVTFGEK